MPLKNPDFAYQSIFTPRQRALQGNMWKFTKSEVAPKLAQMHLEGKVGGELIEKLRKKRVFAIGLPKEYGGREGGGNRLVSAAIRDEALGYGSAAVALLVGVSSGVTANTILSLGTRKQKNRWVRLLAKGAIGSFQLTEPGAGSDAGSIRTTATVHKRKVLLNGEKIFVTNGTLSEFGVVFARVPGGNDPAGYQHAALLVPSVESHLSKAGEDKLGLRASHTSAFSYRDVPLAISNILGNRKGIGMGFKGALSSLDRGRVTLSAIALGMARRALDESIAHYRKNVGGKLDAGQQEAAQAHIAEMAQIVDGMRRRLYTVASEYAPGRHFTGIAAMAKRSITEDLNKVAAIAMKVAGTDALKEGHPIGIIARDAKVFTIFEGTNEVQLEVIKRLVLPREKAA